MLVGFPGAGTAHLPAGIRADRGICAGRRRPDVLHGRGEAADALRPRTIGFVMPGRATRRCCSSSACCWAPRRPSPRTGDRRAAGPPRCRVSPEKAPCFSRQLTNLRALAGAGDRRRRRAGGDAGHAANDVRLALEDAGADHPPPTLALTAWAAATRYGAVIGLAWDASAVTTGPVTVPLVLQQSASASRASTRRSDNRCPGSAS